MAVWDRNTTWGSHELHLRIKLHPTHLLFLTFLWSKRRHVLLLLLKCLCCLNPTKPALCAYISTFTSISAADHPLLIAIPLGSGGDSLELLVPWLQSLSFELQLIQPLVFWFVTKAFFFSTLWPNRVRLRDGCESGCIICSACWNTSSTLCPERDQL